MQVPLEVTFHEMKASVAVETEIRKKVNKLEKHFDRITSCRVVIEAPHPSHHKSPMYHVRIYLAVPGKEIVVDHHQHAHEDLYAEIRDAFDAAQRQLDDYVRRLHHQVKTHQVWPEGRVVKLFPDEDYGFIMSPEGMEIYFHKNSVLDHAFDHLEIHTPVRYVPEEGERGPQASAVRIN